MRRRDAGKRFGLFPRGWVAAALALALGAMPLPAKERHGATVRVGFKDGRSIQGELVSVGQDSFLIETRGQKDSITIGEVMSLRVTRRKRFPAAFVGFVVGAGAGYASGAGPGWPHEDDTRIWNGIGKGLLCGAAGALIGRMVMGRPPGPERPVYIMFEGLTIEAARAALAKLRPYSRDQ